MSVDKEKILGLVNRIRRSGDQQKNYYDGRGKSFLQRMTNATLGAMVAENPAVAAASGWSVDPSTGEVSQGEANPELLKSLGVLGGTALGITAAPLAGSALAAEAPMWRRLGVTMLKDLPAFEAIDRVPTLWGDPRFTQMGGNWLERGFRAVTPNGRFENAAAPWINTVGQFASGILPGIAGDMLVRNTANTVTRGLGKLDDAFRLPTEQVADLSKTAESLAKDPESVFPRSMGRVDYYQDDFVPRDYVEPNYDIDLFAYDDAMQADIDATEFGRQQAREIMLADPTDANHYLQAADDLDIDRVLRDLPPVEPGQVETDINAALNEKLGTHITGTPVSVMPRVSPGEVLGGGYQISRYPGGYMLKSLLPGNPLEKQIGKNGTVNVNNIRALINKGSKVEQAVVDRVLSSKEFAGQKAIDYNKFRKAVQDELITYDRTPDTRWQGYGMERLGVSASKNIAEDIENAVDAYIREHELEFLGRPNGIPLFRDNLNGREIGYDDLYRLAQSGELELDKIPQTNTYTFSSPRIPAGNGRHYNANTLGHSRTYTTADEPDVLHVMESQSDWAQAGKEANRKSGINSLSRDEVEDNINFLRRNIARDEAILEEGIGRDGAPLTEAERFGIDQTIWVEKGQLESFEQWLRDIDATPAKSSSQIAQEDYMIDNFASRQIQENLRYAAEKGQTKMRYPTRETAAKIEGYPEREAYFDAQGNDITTKPTPEMWTYGEQQDKELERLRSVIKDLETEYTRWVQDDEYVRKGLDRNGTASAIANDLMEAQSSKNIIINENEPKLARGYSKKIVYDHEDILKKYTDFPKQYKKLFKGADVRTVTDAKGNTWYEVDVPEGYLDKEWSFKDGGLINNAVQPQLVEYSSGGKIHIKPENRGKFTALKERTGHSASWFKAHGTPAQKKMAVFALNAAKWKHADGGSIFRTKLNDADEEQFQTWYQKYANANGLDPNADSPDHFYDYRGYWNANRDFPVAGIVDGHFPDTWKTPGHPTFTKESIYAKYAPELAGSWDEKGNFVEPALAAAVDYSGIKTTNNRGYNRDYISYISDSLKAGGLSDPKRAAILANIIEESGGNPFALDDTKKFYGLLQWAGDRYKKTTEKDPYKEIDNQVQYILNTLGNTTDKVSWTHGGTGTGYNSYTDAMADFDSDDLVTAMRGLTLGYVRPAGKIDSYNNRLKVAQQLYNLNGFRTFDAGGLIKKFGADKILQTLQRMK